MTTTPITIDMKVFENIKSKISLDMITNINKSPTLISQLNDYNADVLAGKALPFSFSGSLGKTGSFTTTINGQKVIYLDQNDGWAKGEGTYYVDTNGAQHNISAAGDFTAVVAHEVEHYRMWSSDNAALASLDKSGKTYADTATGFNLYQEGEASYNNWVVRNEVKANGGQEVEIRGNGQLLSVMDSQAAANPTLTPDQQMVLLSDSVAKKYANIETSTTHEKYWDYYHKQYVQGTPSPASTYVEMSDANHDGIYDAIHAFYSDGSEVLDRNSSDNNIPWISNANTAINVANNQTVLVNGAGGYSINSGIGSTVWIGGNGQWSDDAHVITENSMGSTVQFLPGTRANVFFEHGSSDSKVLTSDEDNVGVYGSYGNVTGFGPNTNIWAGANGAHQTSNLIHIFNMKGGTLTVVDDSSVGVDDMFAGVTNGAAKNIFIGSNSYVSTSNGAETVYLNGDHSQLNSYSPGSRIYENGSYNIVDIRAPDTIVYNTGTGNVVNDYAPHVNVYSQGNYQRVWIYDPSSTVYITYSTSTQVGAPVEDYYYFWGFGGEKSAVGASITGGTKTIVDLFSTAVDKNAAAGAISQLQNIISSDVHTTVTGTRLDQTMISWSFGADSSENTISPQYRKNIENAFDAWSKATGLSFKEVADGASANVVIRWGDLNSKETNLLGTTSFKVENGRMLSGAEIKLENPLETALVHEKGGDLIYAGTDATLEQVAVHEIGHLLGLGTNNDPTSIEFYLLDSHNRSISSADIETLYSIYPELGHSPATLIAPTWSHDQQLYAMM